MESKRFNSQSPTSPFFALISDAEQIDIQELPEPENNPDVHRSFLVKIKPKPQSVSGKTPKTLFESAQLLMAHGDYLLARNLFTFLLRKNLQDEPAMEGLGLCFLRLKETLAARKCFKALWEMHQKSRYAIYLGLCYLAEQKDEEALSVFQQVNVEKPVDSDVAFEFYKGFGNLLMKKFNWTDAESLYQKALLVSPQSEAILANLGTLELQRKNLEKAKDYFKKILDQDHQNSKAHCGIGLVKWEEGNKVQAAESLRLALDSDPKNTLALRVLLSFADADTQKEDTKRRLVRYLQLDPQNGEMRYQLAKWLLQESKFAEAQKELEKAEQILPQDERVNTLRKILNQNRHWGIA